MGYESKADNRGRPALLTAMESRRNNPAPRLSFMFLPVKGNRTIFEAGIGVFSDRMPMSVGYALRRYDDTKIAASSFETDDAHLLIV